MGKLGEISGEHCLNKGRCQMVNFLGICWWDGGVDGKRGSCRVRGVS